MTRTGLSTGGVLEDSSWRDPDPQGKFIIRSFRFILEYGDARQINYNFLSLFTFSLLNGRDLPRFVNFEHQGLLLFVVNTEFVSESDSRTSSNVPKRWTKRESNVRKFLSLNSFS